MIDTKNLIGRCLDASSSRVDFWANFLDSVSAQYIVEVGVFKGDFARGILERCGNISKYFMVDPWCHLDDWNKPANKSNEVFERYFRETITKTSFAEDKRVILRGKTSDVIEQIPDSSLDFAYIDGDHTLKGITIDLISVYPKIRDGGWIGGDDFSATIWQHSSEFEPTLVFPFAVYFAEAVGADIWFAQ